MFLFDMFLSSDHNNNNNNNKNNNVVCWRLLFK